MIVVLKGSKSKIFNAIETMDIVVPKEIFITFNCVIIFGKVVHNHLQNGLLQMRNLLIKFHEN